MNRCIVLGPLRDLVLWNEGICFAPRKVVGVGKPD
jgi:hypothetical protein